MKLQNNFTTQEQSKRLLDMGVPADSADCYYFTESSIIPLVATEGRNGTSLYPCWSVGRLIEISIICGLDEKVPNELYINKYSLQPSLIENIISRLERVACLDCNDVDFSKLDD